MTIPATSAIRAGSAATFAGDDATTASTTLASTITFYGRGAGHGVGMSQYGARGRAKAGQSATRILAAYYRRARPATTDPEQVVRVLLLDDAPATAAKPLVLRGRGGAWRVDGLDGTFPAGAELRVWQPALGLQDVAMPGPELEILAADGSTRLFAGAAPIPVVVRPAGTATRLQVDANPTAHDTYRGSLRVVLDGPSARVVNRLGLDDYLRGVLPAEMPSSWPGPRSRRRRSPPGATRCAGSTRARGRSTCTTTRAHRSISAPRSRPTAPTRSSTATPARSW